MTENGIKNVERLGISFSVLRERCQKLAILLCTGSGGATVLFLTKDLNRQTFGLLPLACIWGICTIVLVFKCLKAIGQPIAWGRPLLLYAENETLGALKRKRLYDYSNSSERLKAMNLQMGKWFNRVMIAAVVTPIIILLIVIFLV